MRILGIAAGVALSGSAMMSAALAGGVNPNATLIYYDAVSNQTLDPREPQNNSSFAQGPLMAVFDALVYLDPKGEPRPGLATAWTYNPTLTEITLTLRPSPRGTFIPSNRFPLPTSFWRSRPFALASSMTSISTG